MTISEMVVALNRDWDYLLEIEVGEPRIMITTPPQEQLWVAGPTLATIVNKPEQWWSEVKIALVAWLQIESCIDISGEIIIYGDDPYEVLVIDRMNERCCKIEGSDAIYETIEKIREWFGQGYRDYEDK
jgi:hypothetical protein